MLEKVGLVLLGVALSVVVYFLKRWTEKSSQMEALEKHKKLLEINREMNEQGVSVEDLKKLEDILNKRRRVIAEHVQEVEKETKPLLEKEHGEFLTQSEMNMRAQENFEIAKKKLDHVLYKLRPTLDYEERNALEEAQTAWESYSVEQAEAAAIAYREGSIYPLIYLTELESTTIDRAARLQADLDERLRLRG